MSGTAYEYFIVVVVVFVFFFGGGAIAHKLKHVGEKLTKMKYFAVFGTLVY